MFRSRDSALKHAQNRFWLCTQCVRRSSAAQRTGTSIKVYCSVCSISCSCSVCAAAAHASHSNSEASVHCPSRTAHSTAHSTTHNIAELRYLTCTYAWCTSLCSGVSCSVCIFSCGGTSCSQCWWVYREFSCRTDKREEIMEPFPDT